MAVSCGVGRRHGSDLMLLRLWRRLAAVAPCGPQVWELPYAESAALKSKKKKKKKKKKGWTPWPCRPMAKLPPDSHLDAAALAAQSKSSEDIIKFSKFPAAQAPDPSEIPKIETDHWPGPPSLAAVGMQLL